MVQSVSVPRPKSLPEERILHLGQHEGSIKAETCSPPKRVMTGNKDLSKQQRSWLQMYNKIRWVYGRQALNSERKICPNSIIYFVWWKCHWDSPQEKGNAAPKDAEISEMLRRCLAQAPARLCAGITASIRATRWQHTPTLIFPFPRSYSSHTNSERTETLSLTYFPAYPEGRHGVMDLRKATYCPKFWDGNQTEIPPHLYPNRAKVWWFIASIKKKWFSILPPTHF